MASAPQPPPKPPPRPPPKPQITLPQISDLNIKDEEGELKGRVSNLVQELELREKGMLNRGYSRVASIVSQESGIQDDIYTIIKEVSVDSKCLQEVDLLLIGKTGNGKSALGNTILGYHAFESRPSLASVTIDVSYNLVEWNGFRIKVVDGPGIGDTRMDTNEATQFILQAMSEAISQSPQGFHALLLVVKYGGRFTAEDMLTVDTLKKIFGKHFFKKFCIIVMTCGDKFQEDVDTSFQEWVKEQKHDIFTDLLKECNGRIVLFNNKTQDREKKKAQLNELFEVIESLKRQNCRYSYEHFNTALETRNLLLVESQKNIFEDEIMDEATLIQQRLKLILDSVHIRKSAPFLNELYQRAKALYKKIEVCDKETGVLVNLIGHVWSIMNSIRDQIQLSENLVKLKEERKEKAVLIAEELKLQREEFNKIYLEGKANDESKIEMLQKQIDQINESTKQWDARENELKSKAKSKSKIEKRKLQEEDRNLQIIRQHMKEANKKTSRSVFDKLKSKFSSKKRSYYPENVET